MYIAKQLNKNLVKYILRRLRNIPGKEQMGNSKQTKLFVSYPIEHQVSALPSVLSTELRYARKAS